MVSKVRKKLIIVRDALRKIGEGVRTSFSSLSLVVIDEEREYILSSHTKHRQ